jgi:hypothetical protein
MGDSLAVMDTAGVCHIDLHANKVGTYRDNEEYNQADRRYSVKMQGEWHFGTPVYSNGKVYFLTNQIYASIMFFHRYLGLKLTTVHFIELIS